MPTHHPSSGQRSGRPTTRSNTIGVSEGDLAHLIRTFEEGGQAEDGSVNRVHARWPFAQASLKATLVHPGGSKITLSFACRNLSRTGIGLLHNTYVHPGSRIEIQVPRVDGRIETLAGEVARCAHRQGVIHEIGVRFDDEIPLPEYVRPDIFEGWLTFESVDPSKVEGSILHADPSKMDRKIVTHYLRDSNASLRQVESGADVLGSISSGCDLIVAEARLPDMTGAELTIALRNAGHNTPVLIVGPDLDAKSRSMMTASGVDGYLHKPFKAEQFLRGIAEFLVAEATPNRAASGGNGHDGRLRALADQLEGYLKSSASIESYVVCQQIQGMAPTLGFDAIANRAGWIADKLADGHKTSAVATAATELLRACRDLRPAA